MTTCGATQCPAPLQHICCVWPFKPHYCHGWMSWHLGWKAVLKMWC